MTAKPTYEELELKVKQWEEKYQDKSNEIQKLKDVFFSNLSHEIRTPLNSIIGFSRLLAEDRVTLTQKPRYVRYIQQGTTRLLGFVDEMMEYAALKSGETRFEANEFSIEWLIGKIKETAESLRPEAWKGPRLTFNYNPAEAGYPIMGDSGKAVRCLKHILQFLMHDQDAGPVEICLTLIEAGAIEINLVDQRPNIGLLRSIAQPHITEPAASPEIVNMGLSIAKETVERQGGEMWMCRNEYGGYSTNIIIPCKSLKSPERPLPKFSQINMM